MKKILAVLLLALSFTINAGGLEKGFAFVDELRAACKNIDGRQVCHVVNKDLPKEKLQGYEIVKNIRISRGMVNGKVVLHAIRVNASGGEQVPLMPKGAATLTGISDAFFIVGPIAAPVVAVLGAAEVITLLVDDDAGAWVDKANQDTLNFVNNVGEAVIDTLNPWNW